MLLNLVRAAVAGMAVAFAVISTAAAQSTTYGWGGAGTPFVRAPTPQAACRLQADYYNNGTKVTGIEPQYGLSPCHFDTVKCFFRPPDGSLGYGVSSLQCAPDEMECRGQCAKSCSCVPEKDEKCEGNPVLTKTGEKYEFAVDYASGGSTPLVVRRSYRSGTEGLYKFGLIGNNWRLPWDFSDRPPLSGPVGMLIHSASYC